jgi:hypothetical protein
MRSHVTAGGRFVRQDTFIGAAGGVAGAAPAGDGQVGFWQPRVDRRPGRREAAQGATVIGKSREMTDAQPSSDSGWIDTDVRAPAEGQIVQVRAKNHYGFYIVPFPVMFRDDEWWNARTGHKLDCFVAAWRPLNGLPDAP